jgi:hypothetical protein
LIAERTAAYMKEEKDIRIMVDEDIALAKAVWAASSYDSEVMGELFYHLMERYQDEIEDFMKGLKVIQSDEDTAELAEIYRGNIRVMMERLKGFRGNGYSNEGLMEYYIARDRQELNFEADFITVRLELGLMEISQGEREDIMRHLDEMEEICSLVMTKKEKWEEMRKHLVWLSGKDVAVAMKLLPLFFRIN